jgi:general secretion pathway protein H
MAASIFFPSARTGSRAEKESMRTSPPRGADVRASGEAGLTLVEILVVLAIIGVMSSIAVLGLGGAGQGASAQAEARRLAASIQLASDEAMVSDRSLALSWDGKGYSFVEWNPERKEWQPHKAADLGERHELPDEMSLTGASSNLPVPIGESAPVALTVTTGSQSWQVRYDGINAAAARAAAGG